MGFDQKDVTKDDVDGTKGKPIFIAADQLGRTPESMLLSILELLKESREYRDKLRNVLLNYDKEPERVKPDDMMTWKDWKEFRRLEALNCCKCGKEKC